MAKEFLYRVTKSVELKQRDRKEFAKYVDARKRRTLLKGYKGAERKTMDVINEVIQSGQKKVVKTHSRSIVILPKMVGMEIGVYNGKEFKKVVITEDMMGHYLGEFSLTRGLVQHGVPGVGASRSSKFIPIK